MGSHTTAIYEWWGYNTARVVFHSKRTVNQSDFDLIYWKGMDGVTRKRSPKMFRVFITKHVTGTCGINAHLSKTYPIKYKNVCPSCEISLGKTSHIVKCQDKGRTELFHAMVDEMVE